MKSVTWKDVVDLAEINYKMLVTQLNLPLDLLIAEVPAVQPRKLNYFVFCLAKK